MKGWIRQGSLIVATGLMLWTNLLGGGQSLKSKGGNDIYYAYPTAFSPAPYTFAVWAPIFLGLIVFAVYQALPARRDDGRLDRLGPPMLLALLATASTPFTPIGYSNLAIVGVLLGLVWAYSVVIDLGPQDRRFNLLVRLPLVLFLTWIGVATILNTCQWVTSLGGSVTAPISALLILTTAALGAWVMARYREPAMAVVLLWAFLGIYAARTDKTTILAAVILGSVVLLIATIRSSLSGTTGSLGASLSEASHIDI